MHQRLASTGDPVLKPGGHLAANADPAGQGQPATSVSIFDCISRKMISFKILIVTLQTTLKHNNELIKNILFLIIPRYIVINIQL